MTPGRIGNFVAVRWRALASLARRPWSRRIGGVVLVMAVLSLIAWASAARIREGEVGVIVDNLSGSLRVEQRAGFHLLVPGLHRLYLLDRRVQTLSMTESDVGARGSDAVKLKTSDGSNVSLDVLVTWRLRPEKADMVLRTGGEGDGYGRLWVRSAARAMIWREFGKVSTEEIYDANKRHERASTSWIVLQAQDM